jgi:enoyl-CoA hydratase/carnithine racemase
MASVYLPWSGGQLFLGSLVNKGRAKEYALAAKTSDGPTGAAIGWFNHYYEAPEGLRSAVNSLAQRIALFPAVGLNETKTAWSYPNPPPSACCQRIRRGFRSS